MPMTEEEQAAFDAIKAENEELKNSTNSMSAKMDELLGETKSAKAAAKAVAEQARIDAEEKAKKDGDFEAMYKASEEARNALLNDFDGLKTTVSKEKQNNYAMRIAGELAEGANAELLSEFIKPRLKYSEDGLKILSENGDLTVLTPSELAQEFKNNARYQSLLKGNQASGGGANGSGNSGGAAEKVIHRAEFDKMDDGKKMAFIKSGGKTTD